VVELSMEMKEEEDEAKEMEVLWWWR